MASKTVKFRIELEQPLLHPEEVALLTFIGRATITTEKIEGGMTARHPEITHLWMGIDIPTKETFSWHVRAVSLPSVNGSGWRYLQAELEQAALDAFYSPVRVTLPDEITEVLKPIVWGLQPSAVFQ